MYGLPVDSGPPRHVVLVEFSRDQRRLEGLIDCRALADLYGRDRRKTCTCADKVGNSSDPLAQGSVDRWRAACKRGVGLRKTGTSMQGNRVNRGEFDVAESGAGPHIIIGQLANAGKGRQTERAERQSQGVISQVLGIVLMGPVVIEATA